MADAVQQFNWAQAQDTPILSIDRNPALDDCIVEIHWKHSDPRRLKMSSLASQGIVSCFDSMACCHDIGWQRKQSKAEMVPGMLESVQEDFAFIGR
jgi:hypothetical protein